MFDISQTTAKEQQPQVQSRDERTLISSLINCHRKDIVPVDTLENRAVGAFYNPDDGKIYVRRGLEFEDLFRAVTVEIAHKELAAANDGYSRENMGFAAYAASYIVCKKNGINVDGYNFSNLPDNLREGDEKSVRAQLSSIRDTAETISAKMSKALDQIREARKKEQER